MCEFQNMSSMEILNINGYRVLYHKNDSFLTNIQILTNVGSSAENSPIHGMAHILEHMFFKGSRKRPGGTAIARAANDIGGKMNAFTTYDHTVYYITVLNEVIEEAVDILADMYLHPLFEPTEFNKELNPILSEFREREDDPDNYLFERAMEKFLGENYHPIIGSENTIRNASVGSMHEFKDQFYGGENTMISIVGGVQKDVILKIIESMFHKTESIHPPVHDTPEYTAGELTLHKPGIQEAYYSLIYPALPVRHVDRYKQDMMNYMLGGNDSSLLFERIREEMGMSSYGIYSWVMRHDSFSILTISGGIAPEELDQFDKEIHDQIGRISTERLEEHHLKRAKASIRTSLAARSETSQGMNSLMSVPVLKGETEHPVEKALREIESITLDDVRAYAEKTFHAPAFKAILLPEN